MGTVSEVPEKLTAENIYQRLASIIGTIAGAEVFVFGSALSSISRAADVDLIVIYENLESLELVQDRIDAAQLLLPVDLIAMSCNEDRQSEFRARSGAIALQDLIKQSGRIFEIAPSQSPAADR